MTNPRISFCTNCMGRISHLKQTLAANLAVADGRLNFEFVLLNYNSPDDLDEWVRGEFGKQIKSGLLSYYHTTRPQYYAMPHAKNVAHLLAAGEVVCNLDGDNFISEQFLNFVEDVFNEHQYGAVIGFNGSGIGSRIALAKKEFVQLGGYDEDMGRGWGPDDADFAMRCRRAGLHVVSNINTRLFGHEIIHPDSTRNEMTKLKLPKKESEKLNKDLLIQNARKGVVKANAGRVWGSEEVLRNFEEGVWHCQADDQGYAVVPAPPKCS